MGSQLTQCVRWCNIDLAPQGRRHQILIGGGAGHTGHTLIIYDFFGAQCTFVIFLRLSVFFRLGEGAPPPLPPVPTPLLL